MADNQVQRKLTAILSADVKGCSKLMGEDDESTVNTITAYRKIIIELIESTMVGWSIPPATTFWQNLAVP